ncbi:helix-turn-helix transcriptional regulator [Streptomyces sp. SID13666]|uniref:helix-turn-helix domain-containing protein n=1 Tax=unclassified Streptomyces TaxID=2593676 RepID=UPI0013BF3E2F|nr:MULTISPECIES: helix-turn-helix transcriptional regulator [unclassified Streptomyces]NEA53020.1 helix-turn-helix transcriptional regulator [Streptomyces sp. SID13666]NEA69653.1 helix-turn-helix transcriptional regulator [Streptomyces sp. SID13588]
MPSRHFDGRRVRAVRRAADLTQSQVAKALGIADPTVASWETEQSSPDGDKLPSLATALRADLDELFPREGLPDLADLRCDAGYSQYQTKDILGTKSAGPVANAERGVRRLQTAFAEALAAAYGVSVQELLAAQERSFGNDAPLPQPPSDDRRRDPRTLSEKISFMVDHTYQGGQTPPTDAEIAQVINAQAGSTVVSESSVRDLRTGARTDASPQILDGLAAAYHAPPQFFRPDDEAVRELAANLELIASFRCGEVGNMATRGGGGALNTRLVSFLNDLLDDIEDGKLPGVGTDTDLD